MKINLVVFLLASVALSIRSQSKRHLELAGLQQPVEMLRDRYGINHLYAQNEHDLFFAQGYCAARDRLFQFELWRRQASGTAAEVWGERELKRDMGARLFQYRGNLQQEFNHYHPRGQQIITAFADGINACVREALQNPEALPLEFKLLGIKPGLWTPQLVISRHQGLLGNIGDEVAYGRAVQVVGEEMLKELDVFEPGDPVLALDPAIPAERLNDPVIELYEAFRKPLTFSPKDLVASANPSMNQYEQLALRDAYDYENVMTSERQTIGSNNWIVSGALSYSGFPLLANDPHRALSAPSLRYMVHLHAPGWNVVGGGEPTIPGISIGHNEHGAWGLTVFAIDGEDLYVYQLNPANKNQYRYQNQWEDMRTIADTIKVKGMPDVVVQHRYTRHGPVTYFDEKHNLAYAMRCAWLEPGGAPYLASLRINQATNVDEFRQACAYSHIPGENMIWIDRAGDIAWQVVGVAPIRKNWSGLVPVPGDGRYEWGGYLPITSLPHVVNPSKGYWATANENLVPARYAHRDAVGWNWADTYRADRINEVLGSGRKHTMADMMRLQFDYLSIPARTLVPLLKELKAGSATTEAARQALLTWDFVMDKNSVAAGVYAMWERKLGQQMVEKFVPQNARTLIDHIPTSRWIGWLVQVRPEFGQDAIAGRNQFLLAALKLATDELEKKLGPDMKKWQYGQSSYHHVLIKHPLSNAVDVATRKKLEVGPLPRSGYGATPGMTGNSDNQTHGATFRMVADAGDWDKTMFTNAPGQSGNPASPFYRNLFEWWASDQHFPVYYSRKLVEKNTVERTEIMPGK